MASRMLGVTQTHVITNPRVVHDLDPRAPVDVRPKDLDPRAPVDVRPKGVFVFTGAFQGQGNQAGKAPRQQARQPKTKEEQRDARQARQAKRDRQQLERERKEGITLVGARVRLQRRQLKRRQDRANGITEADRARQKEADKTFMRRRSKLTLSDFRKRPNLKHEVSARNQLPSAKRRRLTPPIQYFSTSAPKEAGIAQKQSGNKEASKLCGLGLNSGTLCLQPSHGKPVQYDDMDFLCEGKCARKPSDHPGWLTGKLTVSLDGYKKDINSGFFQRCIDANRKASKQELELCADMQIGRADTGPALAGDMWLVPYKSKVVPVDQFYIQLQQNTAVSDSDSASDFSESDIQESDNELDPGEYIAKHGDDESEAEFTDDDE